LFGDRTFRVILRVTLRGREFLKSRSCVLPSWTVHRAKHLLRLRWVAVAVRGSKRLLERERLQGVVFDKVFSYSAPKEAPA
jgi:hypothetical protein